MMTERIRLALAGVLCLAIVAAWLYIGSRIGS